MVDKNGNSVEMAGGHRHYISITRGRQRAKLYYVGGNGVFEGDLQVTGAVIAGTAQAIKSISKLTLTTAAPGSPSSPTLEPSNANFALDTVAWDLTVDTTGNIAVASNPYSMAQDAASAIRTFQGEVYYDTTLGIPFGNKSSVNFPLSH